MSKSPLLRTAAVFLLAGACYAGLAQAAAPAVPSTPAAPSTCSTPDFLLAPLLGAVPAQTSPEVCGCGDAVCKGVSPLGSCGGPVRVCVAVGYCPTVGGGGMSVVTRNCACVTKDPP